MMRIGIYNANLHTMGGGEKYMGVIAEVLAEKNEVEILCTQDIDKAKMCKKLDLNLDKVKIVPIDEENDGEKFAKKSEEYDLFINCTYFSRLESRCKKSAMVIFFPWIEPHIYPISFKRNAYKFFKNTFFKNTDHTPIKILNRFYLSQKNFFDRRKYLDTYDLFISISYYTQEWVTKELEVESTLLFAPIDVESLKPSKKENIILSVGRFFIHSHNKKQLEMIRVFKDLYDNNPELKDYEYHLCGSAAEDKDSQGYLQKCIDESKGYPITIHKDIPIEELRELYSKAKIFWHSTGLGENIQKNPDRFEHFGITTVEGMSAGVVPVVINKAGQAEVVQDGVDGFLFNTSEELKEKTMKVVKDMELQEKLSKAAINSSKRFSKAEMEENIKKIFNNLIQ